MKKHLLSMFLLTIASFAEGAQPSDITSQYVTDKFEEIMVSHAVYKELTPEITLRALDNYITILDPVKTYFLADEVHPWIKPLDKQLKEICSQIKNSQFTAFEKILALFEKGVARREKLEKSLTKKSKLDPLPKTQPSDYRELTKDLSWAKTEEELLDRLQKLRALQVDTAEKLNLAGEEKERFFQRFEKYRLSHEKDLLTQEKRQKRMLSDILKALSSSLDAHTNYFTPSEASQFLIDVQQSLVGIGVAMRDNINGFYVDRILEGGPADRTKKLQEGDLIISVNQEPVVGMDISEVVQMIRGPKGTPVRLTLLRETANTEQKVKKLDIELIRDEVVMTENRFQADYEPFGEGAIAYLRLFSFYQDEKSSSAQDLQKALEVLKKEHKIKGVILDLRGNAGGLLTQAIEVAGLFISQGIVVSVKDSNHRITHHRDLDPLMVWDGPLIVLTNKASVSASEIVAQTLQDYGRAVVVGDDTTFGKGTFQTFTFPASSDKINPQGEYKVTQGTYYTVSGKSPQLKGVVADIVTPGLLSQLEIGEAQAKYPLVADQISSNFTDHLTDLPMIQRFALTHRYNYNPKSLEPRSAFWQQFLPQLKKNSEKRIQTNKNYQTMLESIKKDSQDKKVETEKPPFGQNDLQLLETYNIMKDMILLGNI